MAYHSALVNKLWSSPMKIALAVALVLAALSATSPASAAAPQPGLVVVGPSAAVVPTPEVAKKKTAARKGGKAKKTRAGAGKK